MDRFPENKHLPPGTWTKVILDDKVTAKIACPNCGYKAFLDHDIAEDGTVNPSVVCPFNGCSFHQWIILEGWHESILRT